MVNYTFFNRQGVNNAKKVKTPAVIERHFSMNYADQFSKVSYVTK